MPRRSRDDETDVTLVAPVGAGAGPASKPLPESALIDEGELGTGGSAIVRRAFDPQLGRRIAVKALSRRFAVRPRAVERFIQEAQLTAQLEHPNIVPIHNVGLNREGTVYFTMRLVEGKTLAALIAAEGQAPPSPDRLYELLQIVVKVCDAVAFAHSRGVIHCDIKPENIMVGAYGEVYLMDWGIASVRESTARRGQSSTRTKPGVRGTPAYMAPEQASGRAQRLTEQTDVFGIGTVLYRILTGRPPFEGTSTTESLSRARRCALVVPLDSDSTDLPPGLTRIAAKALAARPEDRYPGVSDLRRDINDVLRTGWHLPSQVFPAGSIVVKEGDTGDAAYIIVRGRCEVVKLIDGEQRLLRLLGPGDVFGEMAILSHSARTATVRATEELTVKVVRPDLFREQVGADSWVGRFVLALAERFRELDEKLSLKSSAIRESP